jgi:hypothetical protein
MVIIPGVASPYVQSAVSFAVETPRDNLQINNPPGGGASDMHHVDAQEGHSSARSANHTKIEPTLYADRRQYSAPIDILRGSAGLLDRAALNNATFV